MFAVLHIADFALHAVLRTERHGSLQPAALFAGTSKKSVVLAANARARRAGVELGMTAPQAVARCPDLVIRAARSDAEAEARAALLAIGFTLSPSIEDTAPGVCTCDLRALRTPPEPLATAAVTQLAAIGLPATAGIGRTPLLALYAARAAATCDDVHARTAGAGDPALQPRQNVGRGLPTRPSPAPQSPPPDTLATPSRREGATAGESVVSESAKSPSDVVFRVLTIADENNFLAPLPLAAADPSPELAAILAGWGLRTVGDLRALPRDDIVRRFGREGLALWQRATGGETRPLRPVIVPQTFSAQMEFEHEVETLEPLLFVLRRFLERLALELQASQHVAAELHLSLRLEDDTQHTRGFRLPEPTADVEILFRALHTHLESVTTAAAIAAVALTLTPARPLVRQQGLFETGLRDPHGFAETLARVSALVGAERVGTPRLEDTHRPDAFKLAPPPAVVPPPAEPPVHGRTGLPLRRFRPPLPARVELTEDRVTYLWTEHVRGEIAQQSAPCTSSGDWWQTDRAWARREWDIALADGGLYRLLLVGESYFLEGEYD